MVKPASTRAIEAHTNTSWEDWCAFLHGAQAETLEHNAIVKKAHEYREVSGWWAQEIAVAFEQYIGRRKPGQTADGLFSASVSRTIGGEVGALHKTWCEFASGLSMIDGQAFMQPPSTSATPKRLYWRCKFADKSTASLGMEPKPSGKVLLVVEHNKLPHQEQIAEKKLAWSKILTRCFAK